jgi:predicted nucleic acid-binding Zn ribbon protein
MTRRRPADDNPDDWDDLPEGVYHDPDEGETVTVPCPYCREPVPDDARFCIRCENAIARDEAAGDRQPTWVWVCLILALVAMVVTLV